MYSPEPKTPEKKADYTDDNVNCGNWAPSGNCVAGGNSSSNHYCADNSGNNQGYAKDDDAACDRYQGNSLGRKKQKCTDHNGNVQCGDDLVHYPNADNWCFWNSAVGEPGDEEE